MCKFYSFQVWLCDGKHSKMPRLVNQLYTIHIMHHGKTFPAVYAFLPDKHEVTYTALFDAVIEQIDIAGFDIPYPESVVLDFEVGAWNAARQALPGVKIMGCFFHLTQSMYRWVHSTDRPWDANLYM